MIGDHHAEYQATFVCRKCAKTKKVEQLRATAKKKGTIRHKGV